MNPLHTLLPLSFLCLATTQALAQPTPSADRGGPLFQQKCQPCHGTERSDQGHAMLPGTDALRLKYRGSLPAALEQRRDLTPEAIRAFVRRGTGSMPPFRKTELSDADIADIAAWVARTARPGAVNK